MQLTGTAYKRQTRSGILIQIGSRFIAISAGIAATLLQANRANANTVASVSYNGRDYDITYSVAAFAGQEALLERQPWWGDRSTAYSFSSLIAAQLGYPLNGSGAPLFAFESPALPPGGATVGAEYYNSNGTVYGVSPGVSEVLPYASAVCTSCVLVNYMGQDYDISYSLASYVSQEAALKQQPWWGDRSAAYSFSSSVAARLGYPLNGSGAPLFAFESPAQPAGGATAGAEYYNSNGAIYGVGVGTSEILPYANATCYPFCYAIPSSPVHVPAPPALLGLASAFGYSRRLRSRIKANKIINTPELVERTDQWKN